MFREGLGQHLEQIKTLAPILICSMKIFIQILNQVLTYMSREEVGVRMLANNASSSLDPERLRMRQLPYPPMDPSKSWEGRMRTQPFWAQ